MCIHAKRVNLAIMQNVYSSMMAYPNCRISIPIMRSQCFPWNSINGHHSLKIRICSSWKPPKRSRFPDLFPSQGNLNTKIYIVTWSNVTGHKIKTFHQAIKICTYLSSPGNFPNAKFTQVPLNCNHLPWISSYLYATRPISWMSQTEVYMNSL